VEVKAQVMKRSDAGWVPIDGGGLSVVGLSSLPTETKVDNVQYRVNARRVKDNASLLNCILKKDLSYTKGNSLFHHWQTQGQKFGLTFHSSTDATTFEQWICNAKRNLAGSQTSIVDDDAVEEGDACNNNSSSNAVAGGSDVVRPVRVENIHCRRNMKMDRKRIHHRKSEDRTNVWIKREDLSMPEFSAMNCYTTDSSYVQFSNNKKNNSSTNSSNSKQNIERECFSVTSLSSKHSSSGNLQQLHMAQSRRRCLKCREFYYETENCAGRCAYGSDQCLKCVEAVSCVACARALLYHFAADENGDYGEVCSCTDGHHRNFKKWFLSAILSVFMPCLCCYPPLSACHKSCVKTGKCGARHKCD
ncbi:hypothetical protein HELRODRAFT_71732, partial [Helobdella robusta]|uniref:WH1 domain-containing protein n=1 Tax=Helobdella robusta TaxID=6412 RepID=T1G0Q8_HELRO